MKLNGNQRKTLRNAIISAYPSEADLEIMVSDELEENLSAIAGGVNLTKVTHNLIKWADSRGKLEVLIVAAYETNPDNPELKQFYQSVFQQRFILQPSANKNNNFGPDIYQPEVIEELQFESFFQKEPDFWDVGYLKRAIEQTTSVCRIEIDGQKIGTGVLVGKRLVLTNYHVLKPNENVDIHSNTMNIVLRFGCFSSNSGNDTAGQVFKLDNWQPILHYSPIHQLDYILLQVDESILNAQDIKSVSWDINYLPVKGMGINLLQHPQGDSMKISISHDGITGVYQERGVIQYINKTANGSSGSPCFDDNGRIVALHHAQRARSFGTIREGILFNAIYQEIKSYLNE
ncbi:MAG: effector-associated domain EAD1-containing protein [Cyanobacteria bacterium P01_A01_bin.80]